MPPRRPLPPSFAATDQSAAGAAGAHRSRRCAAGRPARISSSRLDTGDHLYTGEVAYDKFNNLASFKEEVGSGRTPYTTTFAYDNTNRPTLLNFDSSRQVAYVYDGLGRISRRSVNAGGTDVATTYGYLAGGHGAGSTTPLVETITQSGATLTYTYDDAGNIASVSDGAMTISYEYDLLGQLTRVNDPYDATAGIAGTTWKYAYDQGGNIQSKTAYAFTTGTVGSVMKIDSYTYGDVNWKDKLTAFNGQAITYDAIGNPTTDGSWNYTWVNGRQLHCMHKGEFGEPEYNAITFGKTLQKPRFLEKQLALVSLCNADNGCNRRSKGKSARASDDYHANSHNHRLFKATRTPRPKGKCRHRTKSHKRAKMIRNRICLCLNEWLFGD